MATTVYERENCLAEIWRKQVAKTRADIFNPPRASGTFVCSNHFPLGRRTPKDLKTDYPSVSMTVSDYLQKKSPNNKIIKQVARSRSFKMLVAQLQRVK